VPRLFVAIDVPAAVTAALADLRATPSPGVRWVPPDKMHLTLRFLGESEVAATAAALATVTGPSFSLALEGVGRFPPTGGAKVLWVGVRPCEALLRLQADVEAAFAREGFPPDPRPYAPHVTLARCRPETDARGVAGFLDRHAGLSLPPVPVAAFGLYSTVFAGDSHVYRPEATFGLA